ncbi:hypothetical protein G7051_03385 [Dysgonomonas sp. HDW5B]|uniref:hypothetical protein n=1 Tax=Dysgonomonas sp. HDW5B TaxID=2714927 RepID=UPI001407C3D1|nr:hypothetical protein [Dysgonomonas sp. HDW5B]QIK53440.1 hypothetical protein G7051_03385 [Dysgonomonas sp. HDW5B]
MTLTKTKQTTDTLVQKVESLLKEVNSTHRYSMSRIYGLYNEVFAVAEVPQSCASCLIRKVNELKSWLIQQSKDKNSVDIKTELKVAKKGKK